MFLIPISCLSTKEEDNQVILLRACMHALLLTEKIMMKCSKITVSLKLLWKKEVLILLFNLLLLLSQYC